MERFHLVVDTNVTNAFNEERTSLLAVGPLTKQPSTRPFRVVLALQGEDLIVFDEVLMTDDLPAKPGLFGRFYEWLFSKPSRKSFFTNGNYFTIAQLDKAQKKFGERIANQAHYQRTVYRLIDGSDVAA